MTSAPVPLAYDHVVERLAQKLADGDENAHMPEYRKRAVELLAEIRKPAPVPLTEQINAANERIRELTRECGDLQRTFDLQWKADQRAIKRWQEAHLGNDHVWPDRANMVVWLMKQYDAAITVLEDEKARHQDTLRLWLEAKAKHERAMGALRQIAEGNVSPRDPIASMQAIARNVLAGDTK